MGKWRNGGSPSPFPHFPISPFPHLLISPFPHFPISSSPHFPKVINRSLAAADRQGMLNGAAYVGLRIDDGVDHGMAEREVRRDGGGQGASGAVRVGRLDACRLKLGEHRAVEQQVDDVVAGRMA